MSGWAFSAFFSTLLKVLKSECVSVKARSFIFMIERRGFIWVSSDYKKRKRGVESLLFYP